MPNENRALATVQEVSKITPIEGADNIERSTVMGWDVVTRKGEFSVGSRVVFFEVDSFLPVDDERYEFLRSRSYKKNDLVGEGFRIKTFKLRGVVSQGLVLPVSEFPEIAPDTPVGTDVTSVLRVRLYEEPAVITNLGKVKAKTFHPVIRKTDELRAQSKLWYLDALRGKPYYITEKVDGMSITVVKEDGKVRVFTRNQEIADDSSSVWDTLRRIGVIEVMEAAGEDIFLQGEMYGPGIQGNRLKAKDTDFLFFNVGDSKTGECYNFCDWPDIISRVDPEGELRHVKVLEVGDSFNYTLDDLILKSKGQYDGAGHREGIVIRPQVEENLSWDKTKMERLSFKVINNDYLLKHSL